MVSTVVKDSKDWVSGMWQNRMIQLSVYAGVMFYVVANPADIKCMESLLPKRITLLNQLIVHSVLFALLMYVGTTMFLDPVMSQLGLVEGFGGMGIMRPDIRKIIEETPHTAIETGDFQEIQNIVNVPREIQRIEGSPQRRRGYVPNNGGVEGYNIQ